MHSFNNTGKADLPWRLGAPERATPSQNAPAERKNKHHQLQSIAISNQWLEQHAVGVLSRGIGRLLGGAEGAVKEMIFELIAVGCCRVCRSWLRGDLI